MLYTALFLCYGCFTHRISFELDWFLWGKMYLTQANEQNRLCTDDSHVVLKTTVQPGKDRLHVDLWRGYNLNITVRSRFKETEGKREASGDNWFHMDIYIYIHTYINTQVMQIIIGPLLYTSSLLIINLIMR